jgi:hypothetical protein
MGRVFEFKTLWSLVGLVVGYAVLVKFASYADRGTALRATLLVVSGWAMFAYWRPFWRAVTTRGWPGPSTLYAVMVFVSAAAINVNVAIATIWRLSGQPAFIINNFVFDFWLVLAISAKLIAVTVPDLFGKDVPPRDRIQLGAAWLVMFALVMYLTLEQPRLNPIADALRPYLDAGHGYGMGNETTAHE